MASAGKATVIGGGFFGVSLAIYLAQDEDIDVALVEREHALLTRASRNNQARVHGGYHYPRSFATALRSWATLGRFVTDWNDAIVDDYIHIYSIVKHNSRVSPAYFQRLCRRIGAPVSPVTRSVQDFFNPDLVEASFTVEERVFDASVLADMASQRLRAAGVEVVLGVEATDVHRVSSDQLEVTYSYDGGLGSVCSNFVFNCTYSGLNRIGNLAHPHLALKHEIAEIAFFEVPEPLVGYALTLLDGPFFSFLPSPATSAYSLTHVRYTPHRQWVDDGVTDPYTVLAQFRGVSRADRMLRDASRYLPHLASANYIDSLFELKTVAVHHERDDARPVLVEGLEELPGYRAILGGKLDNVYDLLTVVHDEILHGTLKGVKVGLCPAP